MGDHGEGGDRSPSAAAAVDDWYDAPWRTRLLRRVAGGLGLRSLGPLARLSPRLAGASADLAHWRAVRDRTPDEEWRRLTASSYSVLVYHRFSDDLKPGQERIVISPRRFRRQLRALRLFGFRPLPATELIAFHAGDLAAVGRRRIVVTVDDGTADCLESLQAAADWLPQLFVPTAAVGGTADWIDGEPLATWDELRMLRASGTEIGSHTRHHQRMTELPPPALAESLAGSREDLQREMPDSLDVVAYPHGAHDDESCAAAAAAGFLAGYTTEKGRNGAGTDPFRLRRVSIHAADGALAALWKATTGEALPVYWLRLRRTRPYQSA